MAKKQFLAGISIVVISSVIVGCSLPESPQVITISKPKALKPSKPLDIKSFEDALAAIMTVCREGLHLPVVDPVKLVLYKNTSSFAFYGRGWTTLSLDLADIAAETRGKNEIHINLEKLHGEWGQSIHLLAHEYGHLIESTLRNSSQNLARWFSEGFAEWVAAKTLDSLGWMNYGLSLHRANLELLHSQELLGELSALNHQWRSLLSKPKGHVRTYTLAFVATSRLIERTHLRAALQYLQTGDFSSSFQASLDNVEAEFHEYLTSLKPSGDGPGVLMQEPKWQIGYQWTYTVKAPGAKITITKKVVREDVFEGTSVYVVKTDSVESFLSKQTLEHLAAMKDGKLINKRLNVSHDISWPLFVGKTWQNSYTWQNLLDKSKHQIELSMAVRAVERTTVPAGSFVAARVEAYDAQSGRLVGEYWYSPATKWFIMTRTYDTRVPLLEEELTRAKIE